MSEVLFDANTVLVVALTIRGLYRRTGWLELPFLFSAVYAIWYLPQAAILLDDPLIQQVDLVRVLGMSLLCLVAVEVGWRYGVLGQRELSVNVPIKRLMWPTVAITLFVAAMRIAVLSQPDTVRVDLWTGPITVFAFFASLGVVSLVLSLSMFASRRTTVTTLLVGTNLALYVPQALIYFRREDTVECALVIMLTVHFIARRSFSRVLIVMLLLVGFYYLHSISSLRDIGGGYKLNASGQLEARIPTLGDLAGVNWGGALGTAGADRFGSETRNAVMFMRTASWTGESSWGAELYNQFVALYVPGQFVGITAKQDLLIGTPVNRVSQSQFGYYALTGTTQTGFVEPYRDFWFFGASVFFLTSFCLARMYSGAVLGSYKSFCLYTSTVSLSLLTVTHSGYFYWVHAPPIAILMTVALWVASRGKGSRTMPLTSRVAFSGKRLWSAAESSDYRCPRKI